MTSIGKNGKTYEENWARHRRLLDNADALNEEARQANASRDAAAAALDEQRDTLVPDERRAREEALWHLELRSERLSQELAAARTAASQLELDAGPEHGGNLSNGLPPEPTPQERAEKASRFMEGMGKARETAEEFARAGVVLSSLAGGPVHHQPSPTQEQIVYDMPAPPRPAEEPLDLGQFAEKLHEPPTRQSRQKVVEDAQASARAYEEALRRAPSREAPGTDPMTERHTAQTEALAQRLALQQADFDERHDRLDTDPALLKGLQDRLTEEQLARREALAARQAGERQGAVHEPEPRHEREDDDDALER